MFNVSKSTFAAFAKSQSGASLVEYAVALIVVTIVGGSGVLAIGQDANGMAVSASGVVSAAKTAADG